MPAVVSTDLPFPLRRGKVRDVYDLGDSLLIVATDRLSAFDVVLEQSKGRQSKGTLTFLGVTSRKVSVPLSSPPYLRSPYLRPGADCPPATFD
jgi:hypothetical protein